MATKKKSPPPRKTTRSARKPARTSRIPAKRNSASFTREIKKIGIGIAVLAAICLSVAMLADICFNQGASQQKSTKKLSSMENKPSNKIKTKKVTINNKKGMHSPVHSLEKEKNLVLKEKKSDQVVGNETSALVKLQESILPKEKKQSQRIQKEKPAVIPVYEVFDDADSSTHAVSKKPLKKPGILPKIAVIIDDVGFDQKTALGMCDVDHHITFSVLPFAPFGKKLADKLHAKGASIMLHLPMEPMSYPRIDPGPGALLTSMTPDALLNQLRKDLLPIPHIIGVNNHMGSRLTTSASQMNQVFSILKKEGLFFIDSRTSAKSQCPSAARLLQIPFAVRDVFLDNVQNVSYISKQFALLVRIAKKHGSAIGIGHPYKTTLEALAREIPKLRGKVELVPAQTFVHVLE